MKTYHKAIAATTVCLLFTLLILNWHGTERQQVLEQLTQGRSANLRDKEEHNSQEQKDWRLRHKKFAKLWLSRNKRDITKDLLPNLKDSSPELRTRAARALGRLEIAEAEAPLQALLNTMVSPNSPAEFAATPKISVVTLKLALARIRTRSLKGADRLNKMAEGVDLNYNEVVQLSQRLQDKIKDKNGAVRQQAAKSDGMEIVREFVDVLYSMGKHGEAVENEAKRLSVGPFLRLKLAAIKLSPKQEISAAVEYAIQPGGSGDAVASYLNDLGPLAIEAALSRLTTMLQQPAMYPDDQYGSRHASLFHAISISGDQRAIFLLKKFEKNSSAWIRWQASQSLQNIEDDSAVAKWALFPV